MEAIITLKCWWEVFKYLYLAIYKEESIQTGGRCVKHHSQIPPPPLHVPISHRIFTVTIDLEK